MIHNHKENNQSKTFLLSNLKSTPLEEQGFAKVFISSSPKKHDPVKVQQAIESIKKSKNSDTLSNSEQQAKVYQTSLYETPETESLNSDMRRTLEMKRLSIRRATLLSNSDNPRLRKLSSKLSKCSQKVFVFKDGSKCVWRCRSRFCQVCQDLKRNTLKRNFIDNLINREYQPDQYILLTLTTGDHPEGEIKSKIKEMNSVWAKLTRRKAWKESIEGAIKVIEHKTSENGLINLHLHALLAVNENFRTSSFFWYEYDKLSGLQKIPKLSKVWSTYLRSNNLIVHRKTIRKRRELTLLEIENGFDREKIGPIELGSTALNYLLKFETQGEETFDTLGAVANEGEKQEQLISQLRHSKLIATSGTLKGILREQKRDTNPEEIEKIEEEFNAKFKTENIRYRFELPAWTFRYIRVVNFTPHDTEFGKLRRYAKTLNYSTPKEDPSRLGHLLKNPPETPITPTAQRVLFDLLEEETNQIE